MARDRQRSKARQRQRAAGQQPRGKRSRAKEIGLDDPAIDESGLTDDAPAPDPLKNASPDVDQAKAAETAPDHELRGPAGDEVDVDYEDDFERGEDEVEVPRDLVASGGGGRRGGGGLETTEDDAHPGEPKDRGRVATFLRGCIDELGRVQWPDRKHVFQATAVVLGFCLIAGGFLGLMDALWQPLVNGLL